MYYLGVVVVRGGLSLVSDRLIQTQNTGKSIVQCIHWFVSNILYAYSKQNM